MRAGVLRNPRSWRNLAAGPQPHAGDVPDTLYAEPWTAQALTEALTAFAAEGVELLVIAAGDGTVRDVLSQLPEIFPRPPRVAVAPSGKTNALAIDLGARPGWTAEDAILQARTRPQAIRRRTPIEIRRPHEPGHVQRGFIFGTGAFEHATALAQKAHAAGLFGGPAVAITLASAVARTLWGGPRDAWRVGDPMSLAVDDGPMREGRRFLLLASTLERLPLGLRPFGPPSEGLKVLDVDAPPERLWRALVASTSGAEPSWFAARGYRRHHAWSLRLATPCDFVLDGECFPGGDLTIVRGAPVEFVVPDGR